MDMREGGKATQLPGLLTVNTPLRMVGRQPAQGTPRYTAINQLKRRSINE